MSLRINSIAQTRALISNLMYSGELKGLAMIDLSYATMCTIVQAEARKNHGGKS